MDAGVVFQSNVHGEFFQKYISVSGHIMFLYQRIKLRSCCLVEVHSCFVPRQRLVWLAQLFSVTIETP